MADPDPIFSGADALPPNMEDASTHGAVEEISLADADADLLELVPSAALPLPGKQAGRRGVDVIRETVRTLPGSPGVYRMLDEDGEALYVGKARHLKRRVTNYTQLSRLPTRLLRMVQQTAQMEVVTTHTEVEALLLESNLIKKLKPRYNVLLRDDKSFPHILLTGHHAFPQLLKYRGPQDREGDYFGPFASAGAVTRTINTLQRVFQLRTCTDSIFASRTRPCLQYQIKRCTAPCTAYVTEAQYRQQVDEAESFLRGGGRALVEQLQRAMLDAAERMEFEVAARLRDRIRALAAMQAHQDINVTGLGDCDVIAAHQDGGTTCVQVFFFRGDSNNGGRAFFPTHDRSQEPKEVLTAFVTQFYDDRAAPPQVLVNLELDEQTLIAEALSMRARRKVTILSPQRGDKARVVGHALDNAKEALARRLAERTSQRQLLEGVAQRFGLAAPPARVEVYDNSHTGGTNAVGGMIVAGPDGFIKNAYRKFNIRGPITPGDDFAMMDEVLTRRFARARDEDPERKSGNWPDLVLIDGGQGQLSVAEAVLAKLGITDVALVSIAKGPDRNAGRERFFMPGRPPFGMEPKDPVLFFLQRLRDEAHRWAIGTHRARRTKALGVSPLDEIGGIGPNRKKALLMHFGSAKAVGRAGLSDLEKVDGISKAVAKRIYDHFHEKA